MMLQGIWFIQIAEILYTGESYRRPSPVQTVEYISGSVSTT